jgi:hypothetical protein
VRCLRVSDWQARVAGLDQCKRLGAFEANGSLIEWATDGHAIALVDTRGQSVLPIAAEGTAVVITIAYERWIMPVPDDPINVTLRQLRDAAGEPERHRVEDCPECRGTGRHPEADVGCECSCCNCGYCEGDKRLTRVPDMRRRMVPGFTTRFDANLLALALACVDGLQPDEAVALFDLSPAERAIMVAGADWRVVVMGLLLDEKTTCEPFFAATPAVLQ